MSYTVVDVAHVPDEARAVGFTRRRLGATAFGINQFELAPGAGG